MKVATAIISFLALSICLQAQEPILIVNSLTTSSTLPNRFRIASTLPPMPLDEYVSSEGLDSLRASASSQFSIEELRAIKIELATEKVLIVDLRQEPHGYLNNYAVSWYIPKNWINQGLSVQEVLRDEKERLNHLKSAKQLNLHKILEKGAGSDYATMLQLPTLVHYVCNEEDLCHNMNLGYFRIGVTDHLPPTDEMVDRFIALIKTLPDHVHLHFHCSAGAGRATTFMCLYDIVRNAPYVSLEEIIKRQWLLGGSNLLEAPPPSSWKYRYHFARLNFLRRFYQYVKENIDNFSTPYSAWNKRTADAVDTALLTRVH